MQEHTKPEFQETIQPVSPHDRFEIDTAQIHAVTGSLTVRVEQVLIPKPVAAPELTAPSPERLPEKRSPRRRRFEVEDVGDVTVISFTDRKLLDEQNIQIMGEQLFSLVDERRRKLLLNLGNVDYLSSVALQQFIDLQKRCQAVGGRLILSNIHPKIYEIFVITKLDQLLEIREGEQKGLAEF